VVSYPQLQGSYGFVRGFKEEIVLTPENGQKFPLSAQAIEVAIKRLEQKDTEGPFFLYLHFMDPHEPYNAAGGQGPAFERYLREVALCDASIAALVRALGRRGFTRRTALIISADHGEAFGQHNTPTHGGALYEELVRVPLIIHVPGARARQVDTPVSLMDIGPTVLDLMGLSTPGSYMGQSLVPYLRGATPVLTRPIVSDTARIRAMVMGDYKVIEDDTRGSQEIYDLSRDPGELDNLFDALGEDGAGQRFAVLHTFFRAHRVSSWAPAR
jgi:arylsulfatase A-like enzyme